MGYREIAERQHGFILPCQLTDEEFVEAAKNGFICIPSEYRELMGYVYFEAYSAAGEMRFGWWLVEHYLSYHVNCPDGCVSGEPARGRKDPPYFQMGYGSFYYIPDLVDSFVESPLPA